MNTRSQNAEMGDRTKAGSVSTQKFGKNIFLFLK